MEERLWAGWGGFVGVDKHRKGGQANVTELRGRESGGRTNDLLVGDRLTGVGGKLGCPFSEEKGVIGQQGYIFKNEMEERREGAFEKIAGQ